MNIYGIHHIYVCICLSFCLLIYSIEKLSKLPRMTHSKYSMESSEMMISFGVRSTTNELIQYPV